MKAVHRRGKAKYELGRYEDAECDRALRLEPRYMKAVHRRGKAKYELGRYEDAVEDFQKAQAMAPNNATINADLMAARRKLKDSHPAALKKPAIADTVTAKKDSFQRVAIVEEDDSEEEGEVVIEEVSASTGTAVPESGFKRVAVVEEDSEDEADAPASAAPVAASPKTSPSA